MLFYYHYNLIHFYRLKKALPRHGNIPANGKEVQFRGPGDVERGIKQIAPEELAAGMFEILKQNVTADKSGLYRSLVAQCGVTRVGKAINEAMDAALSILADKVSVSGEAISVRQ